MLKCACLRRGDHPLYLSDSVASACPFERPRDNGNYLRTLLPSLYSQMPASVGNGLKALCDLHCIFNLGTVGGYWFDGQGVLPSDPRGIECWKLHHEVNISVLSSLEMASLFSLLSSLETTSSSSSLSSLSFFLFLSFFSLSKRPLSKRRLSQSRNDHSVETTKDLSFSCDEVCYDLSLETLCLVRASFSLALSS